MDAINKAVAKRITVNILDEINGLQVINDVKAVRIHSKDYVLLIMDDFTPTLGKIDGDIYFITDTEETKMEDVKGFYKQQNNVFTFLLKGD